MTSIAMADMGAEYARIFGETDRNTGRSRLCKVCGDWHKSGHVPHNCRSEAPPRANLAAPQIAPRHEPFKPNIFKDTIISDGRQKRDYMERNDLAEYEPVEKAPEPTDREWKNQFVKDWKQAAETDSAEIKPVDVIGQSDLSEANEIDVTDIEIAK